MTTRDIIPSDLPFLESHRSKDFDWTLGSDLEECLVLVDASDTPRAILGAWKRAEVHLMIDGEWSDPATRHHAILLLQEGMNQRLKKKGYLRAITWFEGMRAWGRRLKAMGWVSVTSQSWHRRIGG